MNKKFSLALAHLESRMRQSGHFSSPERLTQETFLTLLEKKIRELNVEAAKEDIRRFIQNPRELDGWSIDFFLNILSHIQFSQLRSDI